MSGPTRVAGTKKPPEIRGFSRHAEDGGSGTAGCQVAVDQQFYAKNLNL